MRTDSKVAELPLTRTNPDALTSLFGRQDITPMWIADMEFEVAKPIQDALIKRISDSGFGYEYKPESYYTSQRAWYKERYDIEIQKDEVLYSPSITSTIAVVLENCTSENDGIIIQPPVFMEFRSVIRHTKRKVVKNPLKYDGVGRYEIDFDDLEEKAKLESNKVLILCNPHNPVGRVWKKEELERVVAICKTYNLLLISDEIHKDIMLFGNTFTSVLHFRDILDDLVVCTSEAKTFNLCGISDSMAIVPNVDLKSAIVKTLKRYNLGRTNALTRVALEAAYKYGRPWLEDLLSVIEENVRSIEEAVDGTRIRLVRPEGTYQVWLDFRHLYKDSKVMFKHVTENSGVGMNAGHWFGREGALFMRMNIATSNDKVVNAIGQVCKATAAKQA